MIDLKKINKKHIAILATTVAIIAIIIYIFTGRASFDQNKRDLQNSAQIGDVNLVTDQSGQTTATVNCQDGSSYDIYYPPGETDYASIAASKCHQK